MGVDEKILELIEKNVTKELNRLHDWLETESQRITQIDKDSAVNLVTLKSELKDHVDEKLTALLNTFEGKLTELRREMREEAGSGLGNKEKAAIGTGVGLGALALLKAALDMFGITGGG